MTRAPTPFEAKVHQALRKIPSGRVTTYQLLARAIGCGSCQAVGQALRRNPFAPEVPCHRVISANLTPGGYSGARSGEKLDQKLRLLEQEGVRFTASGKLEDVEKIYAF